MKRSILKVIVIVIWACLFIFLYKQGFITTDTDKIREMLGKQTVLMVLLFLLLSVIRVMFFMPGIIFMVLGGICFGPAAGFLLSMVSMIASETLIFMIGHYFGGDWLHKYLDKKHKSLVELTDKYGYEFMALGIICPIAPSDVVCLIGSMLKFKYRNYIITVFLANIPMMLLYSYLGNISLSFEFDSIILVVILIAVTILSISRWCKIKGKSPWWSSIFRRHQ